MSQGQEHYLNQVKKCVPFIFIKKGDGLYPVGTGFFIGIEIHGLEVEVNEIHNHYFAVYLVTAKHVLQDEEGNYYTEVYIRLNRKGQHSALVPLDLREQTLYVHDDESVDLVIFLFNPPQDVFDYLYILTSYLPTRGSISEMMNEGEDVF